MQRAPRNPRRSLYDLETLFISKVTEKYKLNERELKRAFAKYDSDKNGLLDLDELYVAMTQFLNGVNEDDIAELIAHYDVNGDGKLSFEEFYAFMTARGAVPDDDSMIHHRRVPLRIQKEQKKNNLKHQPGSRFAESHEYESPDERSPSPLTRRAQQALQDRHSDIDRYVGQRYGGEDDGDYDEGYDDDGRYYNRASPRQGRPQGRQYDRIRSKSTERGQYDFSGSGARDAIADRGRGSHAAYRSETNDPYSYDDDQYYDAGAGGYGRRTQDRGDSNRQYDYGDDYADDEGDEIDSVSDIDYGRPNQIESRAKVYLQSLKKLLVKRANELRNDGKVPLKMLLSQPEMAEAVAGELLTKEFKSYTGQGDLRTRPGASLRGVEKSDFFRVLRSFRIPGGSTVHTEVLEFIFALCLVEEPPAQPRRQMTQSRSTGYIDPIRGRQHTSSWAGYAPAGASAALADPRILLKLMFADERKTSGSGKWVNNGRMSEMNEAYEDVRGELAPKHDPRTVNTFAGKLDAGRKAVGRGPLESDVISLKVGGKGAQGEGTRQEAIDMSRLNAVPQRLVSRKSRTTFQPPANAALDPDLIRRSSQLPPHKLIKEYVYGVSGDLASGNALLSLPGNPSGYTGSRLAYANQRARGVTASDNDITVVYAAAALGVVHDLGSNTQRLFSGHSDDISCIAINPSGQLIATGCVKSTGDRPAHVLVWEADLPGSNSSDHNNYICKIGGEGFFERAVAAVAFSFDSKLICAIGNDDQHRIGIFSLEKGGQLLSESTCLHGVPSDLKWLAYAPGPQHCEYITREHAGACDMMVTTGQRHIRLWSFRRPSLEANAGSEKIAGTRTKSMTTALGGTNISNARPLAGKMAQLKLGGTIDGASLLFKALTVKKGKGIAVDAPKIYTCASFAACEDGTYDVIAGGSNGALYCWRRGAAVAAVSVLRGGISVMQIVNDNIFCAGAGGMLKICDLRTLQVKLTFSLNSPDNSIHNSRPSSSGAAGARRNQGSTSTARPRSVISDRKPIAGSGDLYGTPADPKNWGKGVRPQSGASAGDASASDVTVTGIAVTGGSVGGAGRSYPLKGVTVICTTTGGRAVRVDLGRALGPTGDGTVGIPSTTPLSAGVSTVFHYHDGTVNALSTECGRVGRVFVTGGDDRRLCVWDSYDKRLVTRTRVEASVKCLHLSRNVTHVAAGTSLGNISIYALRNAENGPEISQVAYRKDAKSTINEIRFSPQDDKLAAASDDTNVYVYRCTLPEDPSDLGVSLAPLHRLSGHTASVIHLDWSTDGQLLQTSCIAYELLCWDIDTGKQYTIVSLADIHWKTNTCVLGFNLMGIWAPFSDGTDINAVDVCRERNLVVTADDFNSVNLFAYPCVAKNAPCHAHSGHSSHVLNVRFLHRGGDDLSAVSIGGRDRSAILWRVEATAVAPSAYNTAMSGSGIKSPRGKQVRRTDRNPYVR